MSFVFRLCFNAVSFSFALNTYASYHSTQCMSSVSARQEGLSIGWSLDNTNGVSNGRSGKSNDKRREAHGQADGRAGGRASGRAEGLGGRGAASQRWQGWSEGVVGRTVGRTFFFLVSNLQYTKDKVEWGPEADDADDDFAKTTNDNDADTTETPVKPLAASPPPTPPRSKAAAIVAASGSNQLPPWWNPANKTGGKPPPVKVPAAPNPRLFSTPVSPGTELEWKWLETSNGTGWFQVAKGQDGPYTGGKGDWEVQWQNKGKGKCDSAWESQWQFKGKGCDYYGKDYQSW